MDQNGEPRKAQGQGKAQAAFPASELASRFGLAVSSLGLQRGPRCFLGLPEHPPGSPGALGSEEAAARLWLALPCWRPWANRFSLYMAISMADRFCPGSCTERDFRVSFRGLWVCSQPIPGIQIQPSQCWALACPDSSGGGLEKKHCFGAEGRAGEQTQEGGDRLLPQ